MKVRHAVIVLYQYHKDGRYKNLMSVECLDCRWKVQGLDDDPPFADWIANQHGYRAEFDE